MLRAGSMGKLVLVLAVLLTPGAGTAARLEASASRISAGPGVLDQVRLALDWPDGADRGQLRLSAASLVLVDLGYRFEKPAWNCTLQREQSRWSCRGAARDRRGSVELAVDLDDQGIDAVARREATRLGLRYPFDEARLPVSAVALPAGWLQPLLDRAWPEAAFTAGSFDAELVLALDADTVVEGSVEASALGLDTQDGSIATAGLAFAGPVKLVLGAAATQASAELVLRGGELLAGPLYAALPDAPISLELDAIGEGTTWTLRQLAWRDPGVLALDASGRIDTSAERWLRQASILLQSDDLGSATPRYLEALLATSGLAGTRLSGSVRVEAQLDEAELQSWQVQPSGLDAEDGAGRFAVAGLDGRLEWHRSETRAPAALGWQAAAVHGIAMGAAELQLASRDGRLRLAAPTEVELLGGSLRIDRASFAPPAGDAEGERFSLAMELRQLEIAQLAAVLDWPPLEGRLSGLIPAAHYRDGVLEFDGGLTVDLFDGRIAVSRLSLERPFGVAPTLAADLLISRLDLEPLTAAFGFGTITGRLDGRIDGLRLVDWSAVAFDADFRTSMHDTGKRRISRRAVRELSEVGGSGLVAGLQEQVMRMFETFPYDRIGLSCRLANNVCEMGGLESEGRGYTIVRGAGLPRITVVGFQRSVDWPVLLARIEAAGAGQAPIID